MKPVPPFLLGTLIARAFAAWNTDNAMQLGAALAYYAAFSITPLLVLVLAIAGVFYHGTGLAYIQGQLAAIVGNDAADTLAKAIVSVHAFQHGLAAGLVSVIVLAFGASGVFIQLQSSMNHIWGIHPGAGVWREFLKERLISFAMIVVGGLFALISLASSTIFAASATLLPRAALLWQFAEAGVSFGIVTVFFAAIFNVVPDVRIKWNDVWVGAILTAILFTVGKLAIGLYLGRPETGSALGPADSILAILAWVFYSSQILFFGAEFTKIHAQQFGDWKE